MKTFGTLSASCLSCSKLTSKPSLSTKSRNVNLNSLRSLNRRSMSSYYDIEFKKDPGHWRSDPQFQRHIGMRKWRNFRGAKKFQFHFFNFKEEPVACVTTWISTLYLIYAIFSLGTGETLPQRKKRVVQDRLYEEYGLTENDLDEIEGMEDAPLSDDDAESYATVMDPLLEPKGGRVAAWMFEPLLGNMMEHITKDPKSTSHAFVVGYEQILQDRQGVPVEICELVKKSDAELLVDQLLERKQDTKVVDHCPGEDDGETIRLPRSTGRRGKA